MACRYGEGRAQLTLSCDPIDRHRVQCSPRQPRHFAVAFGGTETDYSEVICAFRARQSWDGGSSREPSDGHLIRSRYSPAGCDFRLARRILHPLAPSVVNEAHRMRRYHAPMERNVFQIGIRRALKCAEPAINAGSKRKTL